MKKVAILLENGFEEVEALTVVDVLWRANETCDMESITGEQSITGSHNIEIKADKILTDKLEDYDAVVLPGGLPGSNTLRDDERVMEILKEFNSANKIVAAICAAPIAFGKAGIIKNKNITSYPGFEEELSEGNYIENELVVQDGNMLTSRGPATALEFSYKLLELLGSSKQEGLKEGMMYNFLMGRR